MRLHDIKKLITNTPLVEITYRYQGHTNKVYAKCEWYSLTGSVKDKVAYQIFKNAYHNHQLKRGDKIVEVSSGNMGISICAIGNLLDNPVTILMPKSMSEERKKLLRLYGATLVETENFTEAFQLCQKYIDKGYFCTNQFANKNNTLAHEKITAKEILHKLQNKKAKAFIAGIGTSGTLSGVGKILKKILRLQVIAIEPKNARIVSNIKPFKHHALQGLSDEKLPELFQPKVCDNVIQISDEDAIAMSRKLCKELSLGVGISSGANFLGCVINNNTAITVFPDDNKKYLSTSFSQEISTNLVDDIEFISLKTI